MSIMSESIRYACADGWRLLHEGDTEENRKASEALSQHRARYMAKTYRQGVALGVKRGMLVLFGILLLYVLIVYWCEQIHSHGGTLTYTPKEDVRKLGW